MSKRRFEFVEGTSSKFWEVWLEGTSVTTRYGRIGADGQTTVKEAGSADKAQALLDKLVGEKTKKGYEEVGGGGKDSGAKAPAAGKKAEAKAAPEKRSGPASEFDASIARIEARAKKADVTLKDGASEDAIAATEKALGRTLPAEVRAFYLRHDGAAGDGAIEGKELLSLKGIVQQWKIWRDLLEKGDFEGNDHSTPGKGVQQRWWIWEWVPVTHDGSGNHDVLDLAPAKDGTYGQIVALWHDEPSREVKGKSFLAWLEKAAWGEEDDDG